MGNIQFVLGPSGSGKSEYIERRIVEESINNPDVDYLFLVPEQSSLSIQTKLAKLHKNKGFFNIEVFGFNRLAYSVFDELNVKSDGILDDFGKNMLIRRIAGSLKNEFKYFGGSIDKNGFIDQIKSFISELYQYDINRQQLDELVEKLYAEGKDIMLANKLSDISLILSKFEEYMKDSSLIVSEQTIDLLASKIENSRKLSNTVVIMDGFTGFTPIQLNVIRKLLAKVKKTYAVITIDKVNYERKSVNEHELFYLSKDTINRLKKVCEQTHICIEEDIWPEDFGNDIHKRSNKPELNHLEKSIFRYKYDKFDSADANAISISAFETEAEELESVAGCIRYLVNEKGYRYKDIAVISGNLDSTADLADRIFEKYDIAYFNDKKRPVKSNGIVDGLLKLTRMSEYNMNYESVFSFLKTGIISEELISMDDIERLENYVLKFGIYGFDIWNAGWPDGDIEDIRAKVMCCISPFVEKTVSKKNTISEFVILFRDIIGSNDAGINGRLDKRVLESIDLVLDKLENLLGDDKVDAHEFGQLLELGLCDLELGMVPTKIDMVLVGDITRTRLSDVKVVFVVGANSGIIPKINNRKQIISEKEKEKIVSLGIELAPCDTLNDYLEQFYLYLALAKPSDMLFVSYYTRKTENGVSEPSYIISRLLNIFPKLPVKQNCHIEGVLLGHALTTKAAIGRLNKLINAYRGGDESAKLEMLSLIKLAMESGDERSVKLLQDALLYKNLPDNLDREVIDDFRNNLLLQSASQLESYVKCAYAYYLKYILGLRERDVKAVNSIEFGVIMHGALKNLYVMLAEHKEEFLADFKWGDPASVKYDDIEGYTSHFHKLVHDAVDKAYMDRYTGFRVDKRFDNMKANLCQVATESIRNLFVKYDGDGFVPTYFEYPYNRKISIDDAKGPTAESNMIEIVGRVDRVDVKLLKDEQTNVETESIRVIDYKTGSEKFDITKVYEGLQLQLVLYLNAITEKERFKNRKAKIEGREVVADGAYYFRTVDDWINDQSESSAKREKSKQYDLNGIGSSGKINGEDVETVMKYVDYKIGEISKQMLDGVISKNPYEPEGENKQCEFCKFKANCRFDAVNGGNEVRKKKYKGTSEELVMNVLADMKGVIGDEAN